LSDTADDMVVEGDEELVKGYDKASGYGMVNVRKALAAATLAKQEEAKLAPPSRFGGALPLAGLIVLLFAVGLRRR